MTTQTGGIRVEQALRELLNGNWNAYDEKSGYCLRVLREVLMRGLGLSYDEFWARFACKLASDHPTPIESYWARDVMVSLRALDLSLPPDPSTGGVAVVALRPGDLLFSWRLGSTPALPAGHCAVVYTGGPNALCFENTGTTRGEVISGKNRLGRVDRLLANYPESWEAFRLP